MSQPANSYEQISLAFDWRKQFSTVRGFTEDVNTNYQTVGATGMLLPASATAMYIASDSVDDTLLGTGARQYKVVGIDENWNLQTLTGDLDGQSSVNLSPDLLRLVSVQATSCGSTGLNEGSISIGDGTNTGGVPDNTYKRIPVMNGSGVNRDYDLWASVPNNHKAYVRALNLTTTETSEALTARIWVHDVGNGGVKLLAYQCNFETTLNIKFDNLVVGQQSDIWVEVKTASATGVEVNGYLEYVLSYEEGQ